MEALTAQKIALKKANLISTKKGYGAALREGIHKASSEFIIMGDLSYAFNETDQIYTNLKASSDLVIEIGLKERFIKMQCLFCINILAISLSFIAQIMHNSKVGDFHCGLRGFKKSKIIPLKLKSDGMEFASEMIIRATQSV